MQHQHPGPRKTRLAAARVAAALAVSLLGAPAACSSLPQEPAEEEATLTPEQRRRADQLVNLFEYGKIEIEYAHAERLGDGRGITAGRAGFTTGTGDALEVVERYTRRAPGNVLSRFLPELRRLAAAESGDTRGLDGFEAAWAEAARDPAFRAVQDEVVEEWYFRPAMRHAAGLGLRTPLARTAVYDAIVQHGDGEDPDGLGALLRRTATVAGGTPRTGVPEERWLRSFLETRRQLLASAHNAATREVWAQSTGRCDVLLAIVDSGNFELRGPLQVSAGGFQALIP